MIAGRASACICGVLPRPEQADSAEPGHRTFGYPIEPPSGNGLDQQFGHRIGGRHRLAKHSQRLLQEGQRVAGGNGRRVILLRQFAAIAANNQRQMGKARRRVAEQPPQVKLARRGVEQIGTADDFGNALIDVIDDHGELVGIEAIAPFQHDLVLLGGGKAAGAEHGIVERQRLVAGQQPPGHSIAERQAAFAAAIGTATFIGLQLAPAASAAIQQAACSERAEHGVVTIMARALVQHGAVTLQTERLQLLQDGRGRTSRLAWRIQVFHPHQPATALRFGRQIRAERRHQRAEVQRAGWRGRKTADNSGHGKVARKTDAANCARTGSVATSARSLSRQGNVERFPREAVTTPASNTMRPRQRWVSIERNPSLPAFTNRRRTTMTMPKPESGAHEAGLKREISQLGFAAITLNGVIGGGLFALPAVAALQAGWFSPWLFLICGTLFMSIVFCFARLARLFVHTGGPSVFVSASFGPWLGFQTGWLLCLGRITAMAANANLMATYLAWFFPQVEHPLWRAAILIIVIGGLTLANVRGVKQGMFAVLLLTVLKLLPIALLLLVGLSALSPAIWQSATPPPLASFGESLLVLFYAFVGFESGAVNAGEGKSPQRDIPRALVRTVLLTAVLYFWVQWLAVSVLPALASSTQPLADVAHVLLGSWGAGLIAFTAIVSIFGNLSSVMIAAPRMSYALARDRGLPSAFARIHPRFATPANSIWLVGGLSLALALSNSFIYLAVMSTLVRLVGYALCAASVPVLERRRGPLPWSAWLSPFLALLLCFVLMSFASWQAWAMLAAFVAVGALLYGLTRRSVLA